MPTAPKASNANILREAEDAHAAELASDTAAAFLTDVDSIPNVRFDSSEVGARYAGPDAEVLGEAAASVHCTTQPLLTGAECMGLRLEAQAAMAMGLSSDFTYVDVGNIGEVNVRDLPVALPLIRRKMATWLPLLADRFQLSAQSLRVCDAVVIRYDCARRATQQPMHRDAALISFNIPLSADFEYSGGAAGATGPKDARCSGGNIRTGNPGSTSRVSLNHPLLAPGYTVDSLSLSFRYAAGYTGAPTKKAPVVSVLLTDSSGATLAKIFTSDPLGNYSFDSFKGYSRPIVAASSAPLGVSNEGLVFVTLEIVNNQRNLQLPVDDLAGGLNATVTWRKKAGHEHGHSHAGHDHPHELAAYGGGVHW